MSKIRQLATTLQHAQHTTRSFHLCRAASTTESTFPASGSANAATRNILLTARQTRNIGTAAETLTGVLKPKLWWDK